MMDDHLLVITAAYDDQSCTWMITTVNPGDELERVYTKYVDTDGLDTQGRVTDRWMRDALVMLAEHL